MEETPKITIAKLSSFHSITLWSNLLALFNESVTTHPLVFRAIFDLSNKIALLILHRMYALYVKQFGEDKN